MIRICLIAAVFILGLEIGQRTARLPEPEITYPESFEKYIESLETFEGKQQTEK